MYYSKYFEGSFEGDAAEPLYAIKVNKQGVDESKRIASNYYRKKCTILGNALVSTLRDCGLVNARFIPDYGYLYFDYNNSDCGMYIMQFSSSLSVEFGIRGVGTNPGVFNDYIENANNVNWCSQNPRLAFNPSNYTAASGSYRFCITIKGDTSSMFNIYIGSYNKPTDMNLIGRFFFGKDKRDDSTVFACVSDYAATLSLIGVLRYLDASPIPNSSTFNPAYLPAGIEQTSMFFSYFNSLAGTLNLVDKDVVLIEQYCTNAGFISMNNIYINPGFPSGSSQDKFYEIDGKIYYVHGYCCVQCVTQVTPTPAPLDLLHAYDDELTT